MKKMRKFVAMAVLGFSLIIGVSSTGAEVFQCVGGINKNIGVCDPLPGGGGLCCTSCYCHTTPPWLILCDCYTSVPVEE